MDQIFALRVKADRYFGDDRKQYAAFIDLGKANDKVAGGMYGMF